LLETFSPDPFNWDVPFKELAKGFDVAVPSMKRLSFEVPRLLIQMFSVDEPNHISLLTLTTQNRASQLHWCKAAAYFLSLPFFIFFFVIIIINSEILTSLLLWTQALTSTPLSALSHF
jgi:hypothetical protein